MLRTVEVEVAAIGSLLQTVAAVVAAALGSRLIKARVALGEAPEEAAVVINGRAEVVEVAMRAHGAQVAELLGALLQVLGPMAAVLRVVEVESSGALLTVALAALTRRHGGHMLRD